MLSSFDVIPTGLLLSEAAQAEVKVRPSFAVEAVSDDGHLAVVAAILPGEGRRGKRGERGGEGRGRGRREEKREQCEGGERQRVRGGGTRNSFQNHHNTQYIPNSLELMILVIMRWSSPLPTCRTKPRPLAC